MTIKFSKYEGLGNDFIIIEDLRIDAQAAQMLCDRRRGIGADGVLVVTDGHAESDYTMVVWNADGTIAEMCGNGLRCVGRYLWTEKEVRASYRVLTGAGPLLVHPSEHEVSAEVGGAIDQGEHTIEIHGRRFKGRWISTGNPHFVLFGTWTQEDHIKYGPLLETHPLFPNGANISFAHMRPDGEIELAVWERGCGLTQACGTGACATVAAGHLMGFIATLSKGQRVHLPGGPLFISGHLTNLVMRGPARHVYDGVWPVN